jgi:large conductance mechanosensitive channel
MLLGVPAGYDGSLGDYAALKEAGAAMIAYGTFLTAFITFLLVRYAKRMTYEYEDRRRTLPLVRPRLSC